MKKPVQHLRVSLFALLIGATLFVSCGGKSDSSIMAAFDQKKAAMSEMANISASVKDGVVTLSGECKDADTKTMCETTVKAIPGVKEVVNNCTVAPPPAAAAAPVTISADDALTKGVTDAIKDFQGVKADVKDGVVTLTGNIKRADLQKLMMTLNTLKPKKINNQLTIQ